MVETHQDRHHALAPLREREAYPVDNLLTAENRTAEEAPMVGEEVQSVIRIVPVLGRAVAQGRQFVVSKRQGGVLLLDADRPATKEAGLVGEGVHVLFPCTQVAQGVAHTLVLVLVPAQRGRTLRTPDHAAEAAAPRIAEGGGVTAEMILGIAGQDLPGRLVTTNYKNDLSMHFLLSRCRLRMSSLSSDMYRVDVKSSVCYQSLCTESSSARKGVYS